MCIHVPHTHVLHVLPTVPRKDISICQTSKDNSTNTHPPWPTSTLSATILPCFCFSLNEEVSVHPAVADPVQVHKLSEERPVCRATHIYVEV
jgi:hypothetical protein